MNRPNPRGLPALVLLSMLAAGLVLPLAGCPQARTDSTYADTARYRYEQGMEALEDENYLEAVKHFTFVKSKFAYSKYAALSELRIADSFFAQEKFIEAIDAYRLFMRGRPNHREVPYAMWRIAEANFEQIPSDFVLFPPAHEKDQGATREAISAYQQYVERFPGDRHVPEAQRRILEGRRALADYELYVARFYLRDDRNVSARGRLETVVEQFGDVKDRWAEGAWMLVKVYDALDRRADALATARRIIDTLPACDEADDARGFLRKHGG